ncbi:hypothetical protein D3C71_1986570 [compost metagenome]
MQRLSVDLCALILQHLGGAGDEVVGGFVQQVDLGEHNLLIIECSGNGNRDLQRGDGDILCPVHTADQLFVVADHHFDGHNPLLVDD